MNNINICKIDGKLLTTFKLIFDQGSVSKTAVQLDVTQSSVSHALARLRGLFGDPLFVRAGRNIVPTERAISLEPLITEILEQLDYLTEPLEIDISKISTRFVLSANDFERYLFAHSLASNLLKQAPNSCLKLIDTKGDVVNSLRSRECDLVITPLQQEVVMICIHSRYLKIHSFVFMILTICLRIGLGRNIIACGTQRLTTPKANRVLLMTVCQMPMLPEILR